MSIRSSPPKVSERMFAGTPDSGRSTPHSSSASQESVKHREHPATDYQRVHRADVAGLGVTLYGERLPDGLAGVDPDQGHPALLVLIEWSLLFEGKHLVRVDGLARQEKEVRVFARLLVPNRSLRRYGREVGRAEIPPQLPDAAVALEHRVGAGLRVDRRPLGRDIV